MREWFVIFKCGSQFESIQVIAADEEAAKQEVVKQKSADSPGVILDAAGMGVVDMGPAPTNPMLESDFVKGVRTFVLAFLGCLITLYLCGSVWNNSFEIVSWPEASKRILSVIVGCLWAIYTLGGSVYIIIGLINLQAHNGKVLK